MKLQHIPPRFEAFQNEYPGLSICRVAVQEKGLYRIITPEGVQQAQVSGRFQHKARTASDYPAVGDYVVANLNDEDTAVIHAVLPRSSIFLRKAAGGANAEQVVATNIDTVFLCMALNNDFNLRRLERYLTAAWDGGATVIDTPGMRELGMWDAGQGLSNAFADIEALAERCRFRDCTHRTEPGCAVRAALARGELTEDRLKSYQRLKVESAFAEDSATYLAAKSGKFKRIAIINKAREKK